MLISIYLKNATIRITRNSRRITTKLQSLQKLKNNADSHIAVKKLVHDGTFSGQEHRQHPKSLPSSHS